MPSDDQPMTALNLREQPILYLTDRSRLLRCHVTGSDQDNLQLECVDGGERICEARREKMYDFGDFPIERFPVTLANAEFSQTLPANFPRRNELVQVLRGLIRARRIVGLEIVRKSRRTQYSFLYSVRLHVLNQSRQGTIDIYPDCLLSIA